jgi:hypothetical protein
MDRRSLRPTGKQSNPKLLSQTDDAILSWADPLAAIIDESAIAKMTAKRAASDPALRFQHQHIDASGCQQPRGI